MHLDPQVLDSLQEFLSFPLSSAEKVLEKFRALPGSIAAQKTPPSPLQQFVYVPGTR